MVKTDSNNAAWLERWLSAVTKSTMTQRSLVSVEAHGGVALLVRLAKKHGVHLVRLTNDKGDVLIAASRHAFKALS